MKYLSQFLIILGFTLAGEALQRIIPLPIPASVYGLALLFTALCLKVVKVEQVKATGAFLQRFKELRPGDLDTCTLLLDALKFCADWTATCPEDPQYQAVRRILDKLMLYTKKAIAQRLRCRI